MMALPWLDCHDAGKPRTFLRTDVRHCGRKPEKYVASRWIRLTWRQAFGIMRPPKRQRFAELSGVAISSPKVS
jgi:hypothetical protein